MKARGIYLFKDTLISNSSGEVGLWLYRSVTLENERHVYTDIGNFF